MAVTSVVASLERPLLRVCEPKSTIGIPLELTKRTVAFPNTIRPASAEIPGTLSPSPVTVTTASLPGVVPVGYSYRNTDANGNAKDFPVVDELRISCVPGWVSSSRMIAPDWSWKTIALSVPTWVIETSKPQADVRSRDGAVLSIGIEIRVGAAALAVDAKVAEATTHRNSKNFCMRSPYRLAIASYSAHPSARVSRGGGARSRGLSPQSMSEENVEILGEELRRDVMIHWLASTLGVGANLHRHEAILQ